MYFKAGAEGRISYGHLGRTNLFYDRSTPLQTEFRLDFGHRRIVVMSGEVYQT